MNIPECNERYEKMKRSCVILRGEGGFRNPSCGGRDFDLDTHQTNGPILDPKTTFHSPRHEHSKNIAKKFLNATDDVTNQVKGLIFYHLSSLVSPGKAAISDWNKVDETTLIVSGLL